MIIYKITNKNTGKVYIGQTVSTLKRRWAIHCSGGACRRLTASIKSHGKDAFEVEQIDNAFSIEELNKKEVYWISFYDSTNLEKGYNLTSGGNSYTHSEETKQKLREINTGKKLSPEHAEKLRNNNKGKKWTKEHRENFSLATKGKKRKPMSEDTKKKISNANKGKRYSEKQRAEMTGKNKGNTVWKGRKHTPETIEKMRASKILRDKYKNEKS